MIDFRYHLVSLVAVFLALAIGIVLGAGPLRDGVGQTLTA
ncbi:MAG: copper transporter, partial [Dermabacter sp.]|nr:copper transporter [Dermabacter sp.]